MTLICLLLSEIGGESLACKLSAGEVHVSNVKISMAVENKIDSMKGFV